MPIPAGQTGRSGPPSQAGAWARILDRAAVRRHRLAHRSVQCRLGGERRAGPATTTTVWRAGVRRDGYDLQAGNGAASYSDCFASRADGGRRQPGRRAWPDAVRPAGPASSDGRLAGTGAMRGPRRGTGTRPASDSGSSGQPAGSAQPPRTRPPRSPEAWRDEPGYQPQDYEPLAISGPATMPRPARAARLRAAPPATAAAPARSHPAYGRPRAAGPARRPGTPAGATRSRADRAAPRPCRTTAAANHAPEGPGSPDARPRCRRRRPMHGLGLYRPVERRHGGRDARLAAHRLPAHDRAVLCARRARHRGRLQPVQHAAQRRLQPGPGRHPDQRHRAADRERREARLRPRQGYDQRMFTLVTAALARHHRDRDAGRRAASCICTRQHRSPGRARCT